MTCDRLVCANCAGPVSEGRCPSCRASRAQLHQQGGLQGFLNGLSPMGLMVLLAAVIAVALVVGYAG
ncbi:hypothetical protein GCM10027168_57240 [Streptomyces capparidis]